MAGGTWESQNKVRPGTYITINSEPQSVGVIGERGIVTMALPLSWGESKKVIEIHAGEDVTTKLGYDLDAAQLLLVRESLKRARTLLLYRLNTGTVAGVVSGGLTTKARYGGVRGNDLSIVIQKNIDDASKMDVKILLAGRAADMQTVANIEELKSNDWVVFSGTGELTATAGVPLVGGTDGVVTNQDHTDYLSAIEVHDFNAMALASTDSSLKSVYTAFSKRLRETEGRKVQVVMENYPAADYEGVISVKNGVILSDGTALGADQAVAWVAGATAGAGVNKSLTYQAYDGAVDVDTRYTNSQIEEALIKGEFVFVQNKGRAIVEQDINTFTSFTREKRQVFSKNRTLRALDGLANDYKRIFEAYYIGIVDNNSDGRNLFKKECIKQAEAYQNMNAIQNFDAQADIVVEEGANKDSIVVSVNVQPVDSIEKIYMKVQVR